MKTAITELLNIEYPIVQGAMAWVADADLASAVSNAGGLGVIGTGHDNVDTVRAKVEAMFAKTDKPFAVNVMLLNPHVEEVVDYLIASGVKIITTGAGNPSKYMQRFEEAGISLIPVVASVALAKRMERIGAKAVVVEGMEAGGHIGKLTTMALVPQVVDAVNIPAAFMLGASAVQVGTRFVVAHESNAHDNFKQAIIKAKDIETVVTGQITGHPVRVLRNALTTEYLQAEKEETSKAEPDFERLNKIGKGALRRAVVEGDVKTGSLMAGQIAGLVSKEQSCHDIIQDYLAECRQTIQAKLDLVNQ